MLFGMKRVFENRFVELMKLWRSSVFVAAQSLIGNPNILPRVSPHLSTCLTISISKSWKRWLGALVRCRKPIELPKPIEQPKPDEPKPLIPEILPQPKPAPEPEAPPAPKAPPALAPAPQAPQNDTETTIWPVPGEKPGRGNGNGN